MTDDGEIRYTPRVWRCLQCGTILGIVVHDKNGYPKLAVLKRQVRMEIEINMEQGGIISRMIAGEIICQYCGKLRVWRPNGALLLEMVKENDKNAFGF